VREAARVWGVSKSTAARWIAAGRTPSGGTNPVENGGSGASDCSKIRAVG
jgi:hypothetical protein